MLHVSACIVRLVFVVTNRQYNFFSFSHFFDIYIIYYVCTLQQLDTFAFDIINGNGDYLDIKYIVSPEDRIDIGKMSKEKILSLVTR